MLGIVGVTCGSVGILYRASRQVPDFYRAAMLDEPAAQEEAGDELERRVLQLRNDSQRSGKWTASFSEEQINGWLAVDVPRNYPELLPDGVSAPRVDCEEDQLRVAARMKQGPFSTVLTLTFSLYLTEEDNQIALQLINARAGMLPVPLATVVEKLEEIAQPTSIKMTWTTAEGDPVALINLPDLIDRERGEITIESLSLLEGAIQVSGTTRRSDSFLDWLNDSDQSPPSSR